MRSKIIFSVLILLLINALSTHAQVTLPCGGDDPDAGCPLDTWVVALAIAASFFAAVILYRRKKSAL
jgi:hypothetical protein